MFVVALMPLIIIFLGSKTGKIKDKALVARVGPIKFCDSIFVTNRIKNSIRIIKVGKNKEASL